MSDAVWANAIRSKRAELGLSQTELARKAGIPKQTFQRYETGEREPQLTVARAIAEALDISLAEMAGQIQPAEQLESSTKVSVVADIIHSRRLELRLPQTRVAAAAGCPLTEYQGYESGELELTLAAATAIAEALDIRLSVLAGTEPKPIDFNGQWWATWQGGLDRSSEIDLHTVTALRAGESLLLDTGWRGELRLFGGEVAIGWYRPPGGATRSRQGVFLWLPAGDDYLYGRWTGVGENNSITSGWCVLARDEGKSRAIIDQLVTSNIQPRPALRLPSLSNWGSVG